MAKILIADDHPAVRAGYRQFLLQESYITEVGEAATGNDTLTALRAQPWDLLLMDINMPDRNGLDILRRVVGFVDVRILVVSGLPEDQYARNVLAAGASGFLPKTSSSEELLRAVRLVLNGRRYYSPSFSETWIPDLGNGALQRAPLHTALSTREFQIFLKLAVGKSAGDIAYELSLNVKTINGHKNKVLEKMGFQSSSDLVAYALRNGLTQ